MSAPAESAAMDTSDIAVPANASAVAAPSGANEDGSDQSNSSNSQSSKGQKRKRSAPNHISEDTFKKSKQYKIDPDSKNYARFERTARRQFEKKGDYVGGRLDQAVTTLIGNDIDRPLGPSDSDVATFF